MMDKKYQGSGYGTKVIKSVLEERRNIEFVGGLFWIEKIKERE